MVPFCEIPAGRVTPRSLQATLRTMGYVLVRGLLPQRDVRRVLDDICRIMAAAGWLMPGSDPLERLANPAAACGDPDPAFKQTYQKVFNLASLHALPHHPALLLAMRMIVGPRVLVHPKPIGRLIFPNCERLQVHAHQDYRFMLGDPECFTVWIPLHDCPLEVGPLQIMEGSHYLGFLSHDEENLHVPELPESITAGGTWAGGQMAAGDALIFHSFTVHAALPNVSSQMRISLDCRFQDYERVIHPANLAFAGESVKSWEKTYSEWPADDLKFYWKKLPLRFRPSKAELEELSLHAGSATVRAKSAKILSQLI
ncbi:MAG TPA: phytanoyl-CoA dioxygenase family protein [Acidobacteriaceae bacterium]|nr:phytanoyl-CoA dioxygenase family protein [Acidobacteriaceae bacterium]